MVAQPHGPDPFEDLEDGLGLVRRAGLLRSLVELVLNVGLRAFAERRERYGPRLAQRVAVTIQQDRAKPGEKLATSVVAAQGLPGFHQRVLRLDWTRNQQFTLPQAIRAQLAQLDPHGETTVIVYQRHKTFGELNDKPDRYDLGQEYITPYSPEQNGMIERFFRTLKEECLRHHRFRSRDEAFLAIAAWLEKYHTERPHSALGYLTPSEFAEQLAA